jgi:hypothetical protein
MAETRGITSKKKEVKPAEIVEDDPARLHMSKADVLKKDAEAKERKSKLAEYDLQLKKEQAGEDVKKKK